MENQVIPKGYQQVMPYIILKGAEKFKEFLLNVFGAKEIATYPDDTGKIMHAEVKIGESVIMFAEASDQWSAQNAGLFIYVENADATFNTAVSQGAQVVMEMDDKEYGRTGGVRDPFGNTWWITSVKEMAHS